MLGRNGTIVDCQEIETGLVMGQLQAIADLPRGIHAILNLAAEAQPLFTNDPARPLEAWQGGDLQAYTRMPILDGQFPGLVWLETAVNQVLTWRTNDWRTLIVCRMGISRSALVMTAVLMVQHAWSRNRALDFIREKRPQAAPNESFMAGLYEFELGVAINLGGQTIPGGLKVLDSPKVTSEQGGN